MRRALVLLLALLLARANGRHLGGHLRLGGSAIRPAKGHVALERALDAVDEHVRVQDVGLLDICSHPSCAQLDGQGGLCRSEAGQRSASVDFCDHQRLVQCALAAARGVSWRSSGPAPVR